MLLGIDVSNHQGIFPWHQAHNAGIEFAGMKATEGIDFWDEYFERNWAYSRNHDVRRIAYHFLNPQYSGRIQAAVFHDAVHDAGKLKHGDSVMLDMEDSKGVAVGEVIARAEEFVEHILHNTGVGVWIYTNFNYWVTELGNPHSDILARCPLWAASWGAAPATIEQWKNGASIWQFTDAYEIPGYNGRVDGNRFLGEWAQYDTLSAKGGRM